MAYLSTRGYPYAERKLAGKVNDTGDIEAGPPNWTLELKNHKKWALGKWLDEVDREARNSGNQYGAVLMRRAGSTDRANDPVLMTLDTFLEITREEKEKLPPGTSPPATT